MSGGGPHWRRGSHACPPTRYLPPLPRPPVPTPLHPQVVTDPARAAVESLDDRGMLQRMPLSGEPREGGGEGGAAPSLSGGRRAGARAAPDARIPTLLSVPDLAAHWRSTPAYARLVAPTAALVEAARGREAERRGRGSGWSWEWRGHAPPAQGGQQHGVCMAHPLLLSRYGRGRGWVHSAWPLARLLMGRQGKLISRNRVLLVARLVNSAVMGAILATLFINPPPSAFQLRFGLALFSCIFIGFTNNAEVPGALLSRKVVYRHDDSGLYSPAAYVYALVACSIPVALVADVIYGSIVYWPTNFVPEAARFLFFLLVIFLMDNTMGAYLRTLAYACRSQEVANALGTAFIGIWLLCAGFYIIRSQLPVWLAWLVWTSPFFWAVTSVTNNEFTSGRYAAPAPGGPPGVTTGEVYLSQYAYPYGMGVAWGGVAFLVALWALFTLLLSPLSLKHIRYEATPGA